MDTESTQTTQDKQITLDVPEDRVAEFYAWYARFLAGRSGRRGRGPGRGPRGFHGHRHGCRGQHRSADEREAVATPEPGPTSV